jgi:hypothetical protein
MSDKPMMWIAYDVMIHDGKKNREQFNGDQPAWGESQEDFQAKQGVDVPQVGDTLDLRMGWREVNDRRLCSPERDDDGNLVGGWYWTIFVRGGAR